MLHAYTMTCESKLDAEGFRKIVDELKMRNWTGIQVGAEEAARDLAKSGGMEASSNVLTLNTLLQAPLGQAEVFFRDGDIYFFQVVSEGIPRVDPEDPDDLFYLMSQARRISQMTKREHKTAEIGIVSSADGNLAERLKLLADDIKAVTTRNPTSRHKQSPDFNWSPTPSPHSRIDDLRNRFAKEDVRLNVANAELTEEKVSAAEILASDANRSLLLEIKTAGFAREADILARRGTKEEETKNSLDSLKAGGLIKTEYLLQCRKSSALLVRVDSIEQLNDSSVADLPCASCSRKFKEELVSEGHSISTLGKEMIEGSHWMTVWVTRRIVDVGVPLDSIVWNIEESGEEVDIMADFLGELWLIELKDREFGAGDAHPFNYRTVRYRANRAFVVSTSIVSADAKRVFTELGTPRRQPPPRSPSALSNPTYIEGLQNVGPVFQEEVIRVSSKVAYIHLQLPQLLTGFSLSGMIR